MNTALPLNSLISEFETDETATDDEIVERRHQFAGEVHEETAYLLSSRKNAERLNHSIEQIRRHQTFGFFVPAD